MLMDGFDRQYNFCHVESCYGNGEYLIFDQHGHEISPGQEFHQHVQVRGVLERRE